MKFLESTADILRSCQTSEEDDVHELMRTLHTELQRLIQIVLRYVYKLASLNWKQYISQNCVVYIVLSL
jgi:hypothetical protein